MPVSQRANIDVRIPKTFPELTTRRVLVMEYVDGFKCTDREMLKVGTYLSMDIRACDIGVCLFGSVFDRARMTVRISDLIKSLPLRLCGCIFVYIFLCMHVSFNASLMLVRFQKYNVDVDWLCSEITRSFAYQIHIDGMFNGIPFLGINDQCKHR